MRAASLTDSYICGAMADMYGILPGLTYAEADAYPAVQRLWEEASCNQKMCTYWAVKYDATASSYGSLNPDQQYSWDVMECAKVVTGKYAANQVCILSASRLE